MKGETIKQFLAERGMSVSELARRLGIAQQTLSAALLNEDIRTSLLEQVAEQFGVSPATFYTGDNSGTAVVTLAERSTVIGKQETCTAAIAALERQLQVKDGQIDRLFGLLEGKK